MQEIANFERDSDRDVRDSVMSSINEKTDLPPSDEITDSIEPLLPLPPPFQLEIVEPYDPPPPFEEHEATEHVEDDPIDETSDA